MADEKGLTPTEVGHLGTLIETCADLLSNRVCNDFPVPNTDENWELYKRVHKASNEADVVWDSERPATNERIWFMDWMLLRYLGDRLKESQ